jgi:hypothetical protein
MIDNLERILEGIFVTYLRTRDLAARNELKYEIPQDSLCPGLDF